MDGGTDADDGTDGGGCEARSDCMNGQICVASVCVPCTTDASCGAGQLCMNGACVPGNCRAHNNCPTGMICDASTNMCIPCASDNACQAAFGSNHLCVTGGCISGNCRAAGDCSNRRVCAAYSCVDCPNDAACATAYGPGQLCIAGGCVPGECRTAANCPPGEICTASFMCTACATDGECVSGYGANHLCVSGACIAGDCRTTGDCLGGRICNTAQFMCVPCPDDPACVANYGNGYLCVGGSCIMGNCRMASQCPTGQVCDANAYMCRTCGHDAECVAGYGAGHLCESGSCITGQCRTSPECPNGQLCTVSSHTCGPCATHDECVAGYGMNHLCISGGCVPGNCVTTANCAPGLICNTATHTCVGCSSDMACVDEFGPQQLCINNVCIPGQCRVSSDCPGGHICDVPTHTCNPCSGDAACSADPSYGGSTVCVAGGCITGDCHGSSADCPTGQLCGISFPNTCGGCSTDAQCTGDSQYGAGHICFQGICQPGNCHGTSADCMGAQAGYLCGAQAANTCGTCAADSQCQADPSYGSATMCNTTTGQPDSGKCVSAACTGSGACAANPADFCCGGSCTPGNCCVDADCASMGSVYRCVNNSCTGCSPVTGNRFFVDPLNGDDSMATGSGMVGGVANPACSFRTVTRALAAVGGFAVAGTQIVIVGQAGMTVPLQATESFPIIVPANVTITTQAGPIRVPLAVSTDINLSNVGGFQLAGDAAAIAPDPAAPVIIDGASNLSGIGIGVSPGAGRTVSLAYVTVVNTGGHGIVVSNGTLAIGQGVTVTGAGSAAKRRDGLNVAGGTVNITVGAGQAGTAFNNNTQHGIYVTGAGVINITGVPVTSPAPNGQGTVVANGNAFAGLRIFEAPGAAAMSSVNGLVAWQNTQNGLRLYGGERVRVRNSVFLANLLNGVLVTSFDATAAGNDLSFIDLGTAADAGRNILQAAVGANPDLAGVCVQMSGGQGALTLSARGNTFSGPVDCTTSTAAVTRSNVCGGFVDVGIVPVAGTTVTLDVATCQLPP
jgi:Cys-rich repeat protein